MKTQLLKLKELWELETSDVSESTLENAISLFQSKNKLLIPKDLIEYFIFFNGKKIDYESKKIFDSIHLMN